MRVRRSLTTKLLVTISVIMISVAGIILAVDYHMAKKDQQNIFEHNVQLQLQLVRSALTEAVFSYDYSQLEAISQSLVDTEIIASLHIYDHRQKTLGEAQEEVAPKHAVPVNEQEIKRGDKVIGKFDIVFSSHEVSALLVKQMRQAAVLILLLLVAALTTTFVISRRIIAKPIRDVAHALQDIADGEGDLTRRLATRSGDEVALLGHHFNRVIEQIAAIIGNVKDVTQQVEENVKTMSGATDRTVNSTDEQLREIELATAALTQLAQSADGVAGNAKTAAEQTNSTAQLADESARIVGASRETTAQLSQQIEATTEKVGVLRDKSDNIGSVMEVIRSIAEQTNLLALNAAIEAARAGEQGRGFAVVADEVRSLAQKTQKSTEEIESIIAELQKASDEAHQSMHTSKDSVSSTVQTATQIGDSLDKIRANISGIDAMNQQMANAAKEQSITSNEVSKNVSNIYNLSHQVADDAKIVNHNSQELKSESMELHDQLARFKL